MLAVIRSVEQVQDSTKNGCREDCGEYEHRRFQLAVTIGMVTHHCFPALS